MKTTMSQFIYPLTYGFMVLIKMFNYILTKEHMDKLISILLDW